MVKRKFVSLSYLKFFILDEADLMLSRGFLDNMREGISLIPPESKVLLFSATMPESIVEITGKFMNNPAKILLKEDEVNLKGISQYYVLVKQGEKLEVLSDIYRNVEIAQAIIFCNGVKSVDDVTEFFGKKGQQVSAIYGEMNQLEREKIMNNFRNGATRVLVTTNLLARGIDVSQINIVINYDFPRDHETYIHRIGRTGRHGKKGLAISIITPNEYEEFNDIRKKFGICIEELPTDLGDLK